MTKFDRVAVLLLAMPGIFALLRLALALKHEPITVQLLEKIVRGIS